jgi:SAM-dependent methyltransferase
VIFAADPPQALAEVARVLRPGGRAYVSAWVPAGPIDAMLTAMGRVVGRVAPSPPPPRFPWSDAAAVADVAGPAGLDLAGTQPRELAIRAASPEAYLEAGREHPMAVAVRPLVERHGLADEVEATMLAALREGNEDPAGLLVRSPYVIHVLRRRAAAGATPAGSP